jgi:hypothetical protein
MLATRFVQAGALPTKRTIVGSVASVIFSDAITVHAGSIVMMDRILLLVFINIG